METAGVETRRGRRARAEGLICAGLVLLFTGVLGYLWLSHRLLEIDEYLSYYTDSVPTLSKVLWVQLHYPISLDPPTYHLLSHAMMQIVGNGPIGLRLPALFGFLLFQISLFSFLRRIAGERASALAMLLPLLTVTWFYGVQGRPYGLLLGLNGMALACWQAATHKAGGLGKNVALAGLSLSMAAAITSHFFGLLILAPVCAGELWRTFSRKHVDWAVAGALAVGVASIGAVIPFQRAVSVYRAHYYSTAVSWRIIPQAYAALIYPHHTLQLREQHLFLAGMGLLALALAAGLFWRFRTTTAPLAPSWELIALAAITFFPVFGFVVGRVVAHTADVRYMIPALFGIMAFMGIVLEPITRRPVVFWTLVLSAAVGAIYLEHGYLWGADAAREGLPAYFHLTPEVRAALERDPSRRIFIQSLGDFYFNTYYEPDPTLRGRFSLVYAQQPEIDWLGHDTNYITAINMKHFTDLSIRSYSDVLGASDPLVLNYVDGWDWMAHDLAARGLPANAIGPMMRGRLVELHRHEGR